MQKPKTVCKTLKRIFMLQTWNCELNQTFLIFSMHVLMLSRRACCGNNILNLECIGQLCVYVPWSLLILSTNEPSINCSLMLVWFSPSEVISHMTPLFVNGYNQHVWQLRRVSIGHKSKVTSLSESILFHMIFLR